HLGRDREQGPADPVLGLTRALAPRQPEVAQDRATFGGHDDVLRLQIRVHEAGAVEMIERGAEPRDQAPDLLARLAPGPAEEVLAVDPAPREETPARCERAIIDQRRDAGVIDRGEHRQLGQALARVPGCIHSEHDQLARPMRTKDPDRAPMTEYTVLGVAG